MGEKVEGVVERKLNRQNNWRFISWFVCCTVSWLHWLEPDFNTGARIKYPPDLGTRVQFRYNINIKVLNALTLQRQISLWQKRSIWFQRDNWRVEQHWQHSPPNSKTNQIQTRIWNQDLKAPKASNVRVF